MWKDGSGTWREEDWSDYEFVGLCRDLVNQRASELVIAISDGESGPGKISATSAPYLERNKMGCWKYEGMAKARSNVAEVSGRWMDVTSNVTWQLDPRDTGSSDIAVFPKYAARWPDDQGPDRRPGPRCGGGLHCERLQGVRRAGLVLESPRCRLRPARTS